MTYTARSTKASTAAPDRFHGGTIRMIMFVLATMLVAAGCGSSDDDGDATQTDTIALRATEERPIIVDSISPLDEIVNPVQVSGSAVVPEGNIQWKIQRSADDVLASGFFTASCGAPCVGTFDEELDLLDEIGVGSYTLVLFTQDQSDGSDIARVPIPFSLLSTEVDVPDGPRPGEEVIDPRANPPEMPPRPQGGDTGGVAP